jgi:hypothetical protein
MLECVRQAGREAKRPAATLNGTGKRVYFFICGCGELSLTIECRQRAAFLLQVGSAAQVAQGIVAAAVLLDAAKQL